MNIEISVFIEERGEKYYTQKDTFTTRLTPLSVAEQFIQSIT